MKPDTRATRLAEFTAAALVPVASRKRVTVCRTGVTTVTLGGGGATYLLPSPQPAMSSAANSTPDAAGWLRKARGPDFMTRLALLRSKKRRPETAPLLRVTIRCFGSNGKRSD